MTTYAARTQVPIARSREDIERTLKRYGATSFMYGDDGKKSMVGFVLAGRQIRILMPIDKNEQQQRARWRSMLLIVKAKLEAVASGVATLEDEFLAYTVLPDGSTAGQWMQPQITRAYETGEMPSMLPALGRG